jgi:fatty acid CoA ligase FadD36
VPVTVRHTWQAQAVSARLVPADPPPLTIDGQLLTGAALREAAGGVAARIAGAGAAAVDATPSVSTVVAVVGCLLAGVPAVPVAPDAGHGERGHVLRDSRAALWLGPPRPGVDIEVVPVDATVRSPTTWTEPDDGPALVLYTSGTTGAPKGAVLSRRAIAADLDGLREAWQWTADDTLVHGLPLFHVHGLVLGVLGALRAGSPLVHTGRPTPERYAAAAATLYFGVPTVWSRIAADTASARALRAARLLVSGSASLPGQVHDALDALAGQPPVERYGMTETLITLATRSTGARRRGRVGSALPGVTARVIDGDAPSATGQLGELHVRGATLFDGYLNAPPALRTDGWFATGDAAEVDESGSYRIIGRLANDLIKCGGYRIAAGEIESTLLTHPAVSDAAVIGVPDADLGQRIVAYVVADATPEVELITHVEQALARHKRPHEVRFVDALPRNALGKVQKNRLH